ncbi:MAG: DUF5675 family protein, partial [Fibrobacterota bacterium]|nr:DUF5675 family protein [Fibrobacterota bacterium]
MIITVRREALQPCAYGVMLVNGDHFGFTLERPWLDNARKVSCIPTGTYAVTVNNSYRFQRPMIEIVGVPGRSGIRIHDANHCSELEGCIAVANQRKDIDYIAGGISRKLTKLVQEALDRGEPVSIEITNP